MIAIRDITNYAFDLSVSCLRWSEITDIDVINQSIQTILGTYYGELPWTPEFGSSLPLFIFSSLQNGNTEIIKKSVISSIRKWENRIVIQDSAVKVAIDYNSQTIIISIPYTIKLTNQQSSYIASISTGM